VDTGWCYPSANENVAYWNNPENAYADDSSYADTDYNSTNRNVTWYNFSIPTIPSGATIDGIEIECKGYYSGTSASSRISCRYNGRASETTYLARSWGSSESTRTFGGPTATFSRTWEPSDFSNANFGVDETGYVSGTLYINMVRVKVYYTPAPAWGHNLNGVSAIAMSKINQVLKTVIAKINGV
jgi:hypothetical protein